jgi:hypothetical protein
VKKFYKYKMSQNKSLDLVIKGILLTLGFSLLAACTPVTSERIVDLEGQTGSTVERLAERYCGSGKGKKANPNLWYYSVHVDKETRTRDKEGQTRYTVVGLQYDWQDFSCTSPWSP